jgi:ABC-type polysaccharide/polyol phosphate export permease
MWKGTSVGKREQLGRSFDIIRVMTFNALKIKYKRSTLGLSWSLLNPILNVSLIAIVFSQITKMTYSHFAIFFFPAFLAWNLFALAVVGSSMSMVANEGLIKKISINLLIYPISIIGVNVIEYVLAMVAMSVLLMFLGLRVTEAWLFLPVAFVLLMMFTVGLSMVVSVLTAYFRDFSYIFSVIIQLWFYLTPVLYPKHFLEGKAKFLLYINPMVNYVDMFRDPITHSAIPSIKVILAGAVTSVVMLLFGYWVFKTFSKNIVFRL